MKKKLLRIIITVLLLLGAWLLEKHLDLPMWQVLVIYLVPYLLISYDILAEAWEGICEGDPFDEDFLMSIATLGALLIGFLPGAEAQFPEAVFVMLFFQTGELFEDYAEDKSRDSISSLMDIRPDTANVERKGSILSVAPDTVTVGECIVVRPGERIPLDGVVIEGYSSLNTVALTGESLPRDVGVEDEVISGSINISGVLRIRVTKSFSESTASKIIALVENAGKSKSKSENFIRRFARVYTPIVVLLALAVAFVPPFFSDNYADSFSVWLYRALTFLVVSCPCALVISVPLTFFGGIGGAARRGVLIKGGCYMETLAKIGIVVFDKTGTLTRGVFSVSAVHPEKISDMDLLHMAAHVERYSNHPIAAALRQAYSDEPDDCSVENVEEVAGNGVSAVVNGKKICVGNAKMMASSGIYIRECAQCKEQKGTTVHVSIDGEYVGHIVISDEIKADSEEAVARLKDLGVEKVLMLTGDRHEVAASVAARLGLDGYQAELLPTEKVSGVEQFMLSKSAGKTLAFVGDGINDAPVLARADVGIAMGGLGADAAIEAADVVLMDDKPSKLVAAIKIARRTIGIARQNVVFAISVKVAVLVLATFGLATMGMAVFADVGVMVLAVLNAMRALRT